MYLIAHQLHTIQELFISTYQLYDVLQSAKERYFDFKIVQFFKMGDKQTDWAFVCNNVFTSLVCHDEELSQNAKLSIQQSIHISIFTCGHQIQIAALSERFQQQQTEQTFLLNSTLKIRRRVLFLGRSQITSFGLLIKFHPGYFNWRFFYETGRRLQRSPKICWRNCKFLLNFHLPLILHINIISDDGKRCLDFSP